MCPLEQKSKEEGAWLARRVYNQEASKEALRINTPEQLKMLESPAAGAAVVIVVVAVGGVDEAGVGGDGEEQL